MSADRYLAVCHPIISPRFRTVGNAKLVSSLAWISSAVLMLPVILFANTVRQEDNLHATCNIKWPDAYKRHSGTTFIIYSFGLGFATPLCFIMTFYCLVIRKLRRVGPKQRSKEKRRSHRKVTRLVLTVITVYILCWLPHWISQVALISINPTQHDLTRLELLVFLLLGCLAYSNSAMNPVLYAFLSDNFRKSFSKAFVCILGQQMNTDLQPEPSAYTAKYGGARKRSTRLPLVNPNIQTVGGANFNSTAIMGIHTKQFPIIPTTTTSSSGGMSSTLTTTSSGQEQKKQQQQEEEKDIGNAEAVVLLETDL